MHVVVVGCGRVGSDLATRLSADGHSVAVLDRRGESFRKLPDGFAGERIVGVGFDRERLIAAGIERADALAAVTSGDNSNIVIARVAHEAFEVGRVVARIYDPRRAEIYERLGIPTVASVQWTSDRIYRRLSPQSERAAWVDLTATIAVVERQVPSHWAGRPLAALEERTHGRAVALSRLGVSSIPDASQSLQDGDVVWLSVQSDAVDDCDAALNEIQHKVGGH